MDRAAEYLGQPRGRPEGKVDYKEVLSEEQFARFARLRDLRKEVATEEGVPVYAVFTNDALAEVARAVPATLTDLRKIEGIGEAKARKYGERFLGLLTREAGGGSEAGG